jgi:hypothetical protein
VTPREAIGTHDPATAALLDEMERAGIRPRPSDIRRVATRLLIDHEVHAYRIGRMEALQRLVRRHDWIARTYRPSPR